MPETIQLFSKLSIGQTVVSSGFISATASLKFANTWATPLMRIVLSKGSAAISMTGAAGAPGEVLIPRNQVLVFDGVGQAGEYKFHT